jgi:ATP-dependent DNA ligase
MHSKVRTSKPRLAGANRFDGLYLGRQSGDELHYAGKVEHGFSADTVKDVRERLTPLVQRTQAYSQKIKKPKAVLTIRRALELTFRYVGEKTDHTKY